MEEDITNNAEFPDNGVFDLGHMPGSKYKVCGETSTVEQFDGTENAMRPRFVVRGPGVTSGHGWGQLRPWASESFSSDQPGPSNALLRKKPKYDSCLKRQFLMYLWLWTVVEEACVLTRLSAMFT